MRIFQLSLLFEYLEFRHFIAPRVKVLSVQTQQEKYL